MAEADVLPETLSAEIGDLAQLSLDAHTFVKNFPVLESVRLHRGRIVSGDAEAWWRSVWSDAQVTCYLPTRGTIPREAMDEHVQRTSEHWDAHGFGIWTSREKATG